MTTVEHAVIRAPFGELGIAWRGRCVVGVDLSPAPEAAVTASALPLWLSDELAAYFADPQHRFRCELEPAGTAFQHRVWSRIAAIGPGRTRTYGALAAEVGSAARAVGNACRANPVPLVVPCHRVVGARGLGGFAGDTSGRLMAVKRWLLRHEGALPDSGGDG